MPHAAFVVPLAVGEQSGGLILCDQFLQHRVQVLQRVFFRILQVQRVEPLVHRMVHAEAHTGALQRGFQLHAEIPVGADIHGVPVPGVVGFVHAEAVVVLADEVHVLRAGALDDVRPLIGVEQLRLEHPGEVLIAEVFAVDPVVELPRLGGGVLDLPHVPLRVVAFFGESGHGIDAPVDENAEFRVREPFRHGTGVQGFPVVFVLHRSGSSPVLFSFFHHISTRVGFQQ